MKKKVYEAPEILVVQLTQCSMLANSGGNEEILTREQKIYDEDDEW